MNKLILNNIFTIMLLSSAIVVLVDYWGVKLDGVKYIEIFLIASWYKIIEYLINKVTKVNGSL